MNLQSDERRGEEARQLLENPLYKEACTAIEQRIVDQLALADLAPERRDRFNNLLIAHRKIQQYLQQVVTTGTLAAMEIDRQQTAVQRLKERVRAAF